MGHMVVARPVCACHCVALTRYGGRFSGDAVSRPPQSLSTTNTCRAARLRARSSYTGWSLLCPGLLTHPAGELLLAESAWLCAGFANYLCQHPKMADPAGNSPADH